MPSIILRCSHEMISGNIEFWCLIPWQIHGY
jgi:hypothetical protein